MNEKQALDALSQLAAKTPMEQINTIKQCIAVVQQAFVCEKCNTELNKESKEEKK